MSSRSFDRVELLAKLKLVGQALAKKQAAHAAPPFEQLWFTDFGVFACNDQIALLTGLPDDDGGFVGGVHGERLLKLLGSSGQAEVRFDADDGKLTVSADFSAKLLIYAGDPPFTWPQPDEDAAPVMVEEVFLAAAKLAKIVIDAQANSQQARGLTVAESGNGLALYATDSNAMLRCRLDAPAGDRPMVVLSLPFVEQLLRLGPGALLLMDEYALFTCEAATLWGRYLLPEDDSLDFEDALQRRKPLGFTPLPPRFREAVVRAGIMAAPDDRRVPVNMLVGKGTLTLSGAGPSGEVVDTLKPFDHVPMSLRFNQRLVERVGGCAALTHIGLAPNGLTLASEDGSLQYLIATH